MYYLSQIVYVFLLLLVSILTASALA
ncbi:uncharacterized protein METZ01_LOCUS184671, partial [marine metagenome]